MIIKHSLLPNSSSFLFCIALIYTLVLVYFSLADSSKALPNQLIPHQDKYIHLLAYIVLAFFWGLYTNSRKLKSPVVVSFLATLIFGIIIECAQESINASRTTEVLDLLANCLGVCVGTFIVVSCKKSKVKIT